MMIATLPRHSTLDYTGEPLGPGWLRRAASVPDTRETASPDVWRTGPRRCFVDALIAAIDTAREQVQLCSFLLADERIADALIRAAERKVRVYVLTASEHRLDSTKDPDNAFDQRMIAQHKALLASLADAVLLRSAEHIHAKFLVVDARRDDTQAWLSTANFNKALEENFELGIRLQGDNAKALAHCFNWAFWCEAQRELRGANRLVEIKAPPAQPKLPMHPCVVATVQGSHTLRDMVIAKIRGARHEILASSYGLGADHMVIDELVKAAERNVRVSLLTRPRAAVAAGVARLAGAGIRVFAHDKLHAKALVVDDAALVTTANFDGDGMDSGFEVGAVLPHDAAAAVAQTLRDWIDSFPWTYRLDATRGEHLGDFCPANKGLRDGVIRVVAKHEQMQADVEAHDALSLDSAPAPQSRPVAPSHELPQRLTLRWNVKAPRLPAGATEWKPAGPRDGKLADTQTRQLSGPPVYQLGKDKYVVVRRPEDAEQARNLAAQMGARLVLDCA